jgi:hypothetical protein
MIRSKHQRQRTPEYKQMQKQHATPLASTVQRNARCAYIIHASIAAGATPQYNVQAQGPFVTNPFSTGLLPQYKRHTWPAEGCGNRHLWHGQDQQSIPGSKQCTRSKEDDIKMKQPQKAP